MDIKQITIAAIQHSIFCDSEILTDYFDSPNDYFQKTFGCTVQEAEELLECKFDFEYMWKKSIYKCKTCGKTIELYSCDFDCFGEEVLWGHIQLEHEDVFEEVQDLETPFMIEECYEEGI